MSVNWAKRLERANARHGAKLAHMLELEFQRLAGGVDLKRPDRAVRAHQGRLAALLGAHKQATAVTFGWLTLEMLAPSDQTKADKPNELTRAERVGRVITELARMVATGAIARRLAETLGRNQLLISHIEVLLISGPDPSPAVIAAQLIEDRRVAATVALAYAEAAGVAPDLEALEQQLANDARARRGLLPDPSRGNGGRGTPPIKPPPAPPGGPPPRRSRFSILVERLVREEAPVRARVIARTSSRMIANTLGQAAAGGWSEERTAKALQAALGGVVARYRARAIVRTELGSAQNGAGFALARERAALGLEIDKTWTTAGDGRESEGGRTRDSHADANGQTVPLEEPFQVGAALLMYPHDPRGPLGEIINCRCGQVFRIRAQSAPAAPR